MQHFYDAQIKRYLSQFMRLMSNFSYKDSKGKIVQVPVRYGDMNRQVAQVMKKNSENVVASAPFIACYIKNVEFARDRIQDPTFISKVNIRERAYDAAGNEYLNVQGANYTVERIMPTPFNLTFTTDIWTTNLDQKLQLFEQISVLFNPSMEIQTSSNYIDWTSLSVIELKDVTFSSRQIPQGMEQDIDILTMNFTTPIWITSPAKVKQLGIITKIIASIFDESPGTIESMRGLIEGSDTDYYYGRNPIAVEVTTLGNLSVMIINNTAKLIAPEGNRSVTNSNKIDPPQHFGPDVVWSNILDFYPGKFTAGLSQVRLLKPDGNEIVGFLSLDPSDDSTMHVNWDTDTIPMNTLISDLNDLLPRGTVDAVIDPTRFDPRITLPNGAMTNPEVDTRFLILDDINTDLSLGEDGPVAWKNSDGTDFVGQANNIIQWNGTQWTTIFNAAAATEVTYITNSRTGIQYAWDGEAWLKSYEGIYEPLKWRLVL